MINQTDYATKPYRGTPRSVRGLVVAAVLALGLPLLVRAADGEIGDAPPMNGRIVYTRAHEAQWDLFTANPDGSGEGQLTNAKDTNPIGEDGPRWSPDGRELVYTTLDRDGEVASIWRLPFTGGTPTPVLTEPGRGDPAWSPTGQEIAFSGSHTGGGESTYDLKVWSAGSVRVLVRSNLQDERGPDWSPDGDEIAYEVEPTKSDPAKDNAWGIRIINADGTNDRKLLDWPQTSERHPRWSPDGQTIAFVSFANKIGLGRGTLWLLDATTGATTPLVHGVAGPATWSPDGQAIIFYNTIMEGPSLAARPDLPDVTAQNPQLLGLYLIDQHDRSLYRLRGAAGGAQAKPEGYEWGFAPDWTAGTATPTPAVTPTFTATATSSATATARPSPTTTRTATPTASPTSLEPTPTPRPAAILLPVLYRDYEREPSPSPSPTSSEPTTPEP